MSISKILLIVAMFLALLGAFGVPKDSRVNLTALGIAVFFLSLLIYQGVVR